MFTLSHIVQLFQHYKYLLIFPFAVFEGPIVTIIAGFLSSLRQLNFWLAFAVVAFGDLAGDSFYYALGRFGRKRFLEKYGKYVGLHMARVEKLELHFQNHPWKIFGFGKFAHGTGSLILAAAGLAKVPYFKFLGYNIPTTLANSLVLITIGFYFGHAYESFDTYFGYASLGFIAILASAYIYFLWRAKKAVLD